MTAAQPLKTAAEGKEPYSILLVDDDPTVVRIMGSILADYTPLRFATSGSDALLIARKSVPDLMLLDVEMPGLNGFDVCRAFKEDRVLSKVPIIFVTSHEDAKLEAEGLKLGAVDFITKPPRAALVLARVRAQLGIKRLADTLRNPVTSDFSTGTANRRHFEDSLQHEWVRAQRAGAPLCVLLVDIDNFTDWTQRSEAAAQRLVSDLADALRSVVKRPADLLARYAAGTFAAMLPETDFLGGTLVAQRAVQVVEQLRISVETAPDVGQLIASVGVGYHIARAPETNAPFAASSYVPTVDGLVATAAQAVATARQSGRHEAVLLEWHVPETA